MNFFCYLVIVFPSSNTNPEKVFWLTTFIYNLNCKATLDENNNKQIIRQQEKNIDFAPPNVQYDQASFNIFLFHTLIKDLNYLWCNWEYARFFHLKANLTLFYKPSHSPLQGSIPWKIE